MEILQTVWNYVIDSVIGSIISDLGFSVAAGVGSTLFIILLFLYWKYKRDYYPYRIGAKDAKLVLKQNNKELKNTNFSACETHSEKVKLLQDEICLLSPHFSKKNNQKNEILEKIKKMTVGPCSICVVLHFFTCVNTIIEISPTHKHKVQNSFVSFSLH